MLPRRPQQQADRAAVVRGLEPGLGGQLKPARAAHVETAGIGNDHGDARAGSQGQVGGPQAGRVVGWVDQQRAIEQSMVEPGGLAAAARPEQGVGIGPAAPPDPDDAAVTSARPCRAGIVGLNGPPSQVDHQGQRRHPQVVARRGCRIGVIEAAAAPFVHASAGQ